MELKKLSIMILSLLNDFEGQNRVKRQRLINKLLAPEFDTGLHAVAK